MFNQLATKYLSNVHDVESSIRDEAMQDKKPSLIKTSGTSPSARDVS